MTREDIIRMARQAGFPDYAMGLASEDAWQKTELFAALVAEAEREACAKVCEMQENRIVQTHPARIEFEPNSMMARKCAGAIRARGCQK
jgi:hypothetical protein